MDALFRNSRRKLSQGLLFWREVGEGIPVIFLHGAWNDSSQWISVMELLWQDFHCFAPDLYGFGESEYPDVHYSIDLQVESLAEFVDALKLEKFYLVGHSLGGWIAARYALKYPEQIDGLVLLAPEGVEIEGQQARWRKMRQLVNGSSLVFKLLRFLRPLTKALGWNANIERDWQFRQVMLQYPTACHILFQRRQPEIEAELLHNQLHSLKAPVLILQGGKDTPETVAMSQAYAQQVTRASLKMIANAEADLPESHAGLVAADIREFITIFDASFG
ncbi:MAG: alpha/beta hydrolase [Rhizonema sp. PD37]|nr:alpha/beta hydrolase [Rhizonema sp. PD37]